ncbi:glycosyltransferase [Vaginella massiliensis]|uniref:glycosyltransferase n=1 Tax=Vaginella massiliensis TaxID=1816680 RepID=UPI000837C11E|nr:glycosyltransferase [Vaginella massiliensis]
MKILAAVINNIENDQRLDKVCRSLLKFGFDVELIGSDHRGSRKLDKPFRTHLIHVHYKDSYKFYLEYNWKLFWVLWERTDQQTILLANDLDTLLPYYLISKLKKRPLVFDSHEIYSEMPSLSARPRTKKVWKMLERFLIPKIKHFYTVSEGYATWFEQEYKVKPAVIRNLPKLIKWNETEETVFFPLPPNPLDQPIVLYQGDVNISRGLEKMIAAFQFIDFAQLWIVGDGPNKATIEKLRHNLQLQDRVHFLGRVNADLLKSITPLADIGISIEEDHGLSYRYALPNKLFDYIQARVPVLGSNLPEIEKIINTYDIGEVIRNHEPDEIKSKIEQMLANGKTHYRENLTIASRKLCWENEEQKLKEIFDRFKV